LAAPRVSLMRSYYTLSDYPHEMVEIEWAKCGRHGRLRTAQLLAEHGPDIKLPDLLGVIAQCPKWGSMSDACEGRPCVRASWYNFPQQAGCLELQIW